MGNSTIKLQSVFDRARGKGIPTPMTGPSGFDVDTALTMANDALAIFVSSRFNWKWNRGIAAPFYTNSYQQDYPQLGLTKIGWLEKADRIDINNTAMPKPLKEITVRRDLSRTSNTWAPITEVAWDYNQNLTFGMWPGPGVVYYPLIASVVNQNPIMSFIDGNGNLLILTTFGTTGMSQPELPANSAEGTTLDDGNCVWTCVSPNSQGFRVGPRLPGASGPVWQVIVTFQMKAQRFATLQTTLDPIPDDYSQHFQTGVEAQCFKGSPNPADKARGDQAEAEWINALVRAAKQGDKEVDQSQMIPGSSPVDSVYGWRRNPQDPSEPY